MPRRPLDEQALVELVDPLVHDTFADEIATSILTRYVHEFENFQRKFAELEREQS